MANKAITGTTRILEHDKRNCRRCGHPDFWHTHDDHACISTHFQPCYPEGAPFRCLGYDVWKDGTPGGTPETRCGCPDFAKEADRG